MTGGSDLATERSTRDLPRRVAEGDDPLSLARDGSPDALAALDALPPEVVAEAARDLPARQRYELLELSDRVAEVVPLLSEAEFTSTVRAVGVADAGWLVAFATAEQRVAAIDLDCWKDFRLSRSRLFEWLDAMIEAGPETLVVAFDELDPELWVVALKTMADFRLAGPGADGESDALDDWTTQDGTVWYAPRTSEDEERLREILETAMTHAPGHYWRLVFGALSESRGEAADAAAHAHRGRMNDLGFPDRERAMRAYRPLGVDAAPTVDVGPAEGDAAHALEAVPLPHRLAGTLVGRALSELPAARASELVGLVLGVANALAVADELPLAEPESVERSLAKAVRGIDRGLAALARARNERPSRVLDGTAPLDLFRIGATIDPALGPGKSLADLERDEEHADWNELLEEIDPEDRTIAPDGKPA